jgi:hypothetical protein
VSFIFVAQVMLVILTVVLGTVAVAIWAVATNVEPPWLKVKEFLKIQQIKSTWKFSDIFRPFK